MAANTLGYTPGVGAQVATDQDLGGAHHQKAVVEYVDDNGVTSTISSDRPLPALVDRTDNLLQMLGRLVKILESNAVVDSSQRQRIAVDWITAGTTLPTVTTVGTVTTCSTVSSVTNVAAQTGMAGMDREMYINIAKQTYATSIRPRLEFI